MLQQLLYAVRTGFGLMTRTGAAVCAIFAMVYARLEMYCVSDHAVHLPQNIQQTKMLNVLWKLPLTFIYILLITVSFNVHAITPPGTQIDNTATATFDFSATASSASSNTVSLITTIIKTASSITMYQYDVTGSSSLTPTVVTQNATSGPPASGFVVSADPVVPVVGGGANVLTPTDPQPLNIASLYATGDPVFIHLISRIMHGII